MPPTQLIGEKFHRLLDLGRGGQARVSLAVMAGPQAFRKLVVLKELRPDVARDAKNRENFRAEARLAARLNHPNVVQTLEVFEHNDHDFIVMEYLDGQALAQIWKRRRMQLAMALSVLRDLCGALHYTHELRDYGGRDLSPVHRDVSAQNVFVTYAGQVKLVDFGIAQWTERPAKLPDFSGKPAYMAPEHARGERVDRRADIFSVGILLLEAARGVSPWTGLTEPQIHAALRRGEVPEPEAGAIEPDLEAIIRRALRPKPEDRFQTAQELQSALEAYLKRRHALVTQRELSAFVSSAFEMERGSNRTVIEEKVKSVTGSHDRLPSLNLGGALPPPRSAPPRPAVPPAPPPKAHEYPGGSGRGLPPPRPAPPPARSTSAPAGTSPMAHSQRADSPSAHAPQATVPSVREPGQHTPSHKPPIPTPSRRSSLIHGVLGKGTLGQDSTTPHSPAPGLLSEGPLLHRDRSTSELQLQHPYEIIAQVGSSRLVFAARNITTEADVAVKLLRTQPGLDLGVRFGALAGLRSENTARIWDVGLIEGRPTLGYLIRELVDGESLATVALQEAGSRTQRAVRSVVEVLLSLAEAHEQGLVHGRLSPEHVLVRAPGSDQECVKVIGYEGKISKAEPETARFYQSPEQRAGAKPTITTDLYAVGALLHWLLFQEPPLRDDHRLHPPESDPEGIWQNADLQAFFERTLTRDPLSRYQSAADALQGLATLTFPSPLSEPLAEVRQSLMRPRNPFACSASKGRISVKMLRNELMSTRTVTVWVLDDDPAIRADDVQGALAALSGRYEVRHLGQADRQLAIRQLSSGETLPPWIILFGDLSVLVEDPVLASLSRCGELSKLLISSHENFELLHNSINQTGLDHHLSLPLRADAIEAAIEDLVRRTRRLNNHYDEVRLALRTARDRVGELSRALAASAPPSAMTSGTYEAADFQAVTRAR